MNMIDKSKTHSALNTTHKNLSRQEFFYIRLEALRAALKAQAESFNKLSSRNNRPAGRPGGCNGREF